jgi:hypothetical protein
MEYWTERADAVTKKRHSNRIKLLDAGPKCRENDKNKGESLMKKILVGIIFTIMLASSAVMANAKNNKAHLKLSKDNVKINCAYCHTTTKIPKKKGQDLSALYKGTSCSGTDCHKADGTTPKKAAK